MNGQDLDELELQIAIEQEQARAMRQQKPARQQQRNQGPEEKDAWYKDFGQGLGYSGLSTYYGIKDLFTDLDAEEEERLADWKLDASESGWGTAGQITGELAQLAIPGGAGLKAARALSKGGKLAQTLAKGAPLAADVAGSAGLGYIQKPNFGQDRSNNALEGAGGALLGWGLGRAGSKLYRGVNKTPEAQKLLNEGVALTPGQASKSGIPRTVEALMSWAPFVGQGTQRARQRSLAQWNNTVLNKAAPTGKKIIGEGSEGVRNLSKAFEDSYKDAWGAAGRPRANKVVDLVDTAVRQGRELDQESRRVVGNALKRLNEATRDYSPERISQLDKHLRKQIESSAKQKNFELADVLKRMRKNLRSSVGEDSAQKLKAIDSKYGGFLAVIDASSSKKALRSGGVFEPQQLLDSSAKFAGRKKAAEGFGPLRDIIDEGLETVGRKEVKPLINLRKAIVRNMPSVPGMDFGGRLALGQTSGQKALQRAAASPFSQWLRNYVSPARLGGGALNEED